MNSNLGFTFAIITSFFKIFIAYKNPVRFSRPRTTFPNVPLPNTFKNSKFSKSCKHFFPKLCIKFLKNHKKRNVPRIFSRWALNFLNIKCLPPATLLEHRHFMTKTLAIGEIIGNFYLLLPQNIFIFEISGGEDSAEPINPSPWERP